MAFQYLQMTTTCAWCCTFCSCHMELEGVLVITHYYYYLVDLIFFIATEWIKRTHGTHYRVRTHLENLEKYLFFARAFQGHEKTLEKQEIAEYLEKVMIL